MALNRYSTLPKINIRNNQHLTDNNIYDNTLAKKQLSYDTTAANTENALKQASQLSGTGNAANAYVAKINEDLKNQVGQYAGQDLGSAAVKNQLHGIISTAAADPKLKEIQAVNAHKAELDKKYDAMEANGEIAPSQAYFYKKGWDEYGQTMDANSVPQHVMKAANLTEERKKLFNDIKASGADQIKMMGDLAYKTSSKGVSLGRLNKAAQNQLSTYANSHAGRQELMDFKMGQETGSIPKDADFNQYLLKNLMSTGENFAYSDFSTNQDSTINHQSDRAYAEKKAKEADYNGEGFAPAMKNPYGNMELDSDGRKDQNAVLDIWDWATGSDSRSDADRKQETDFNALYSKSGFKGTKQDFATELSKSPNIKVKYYSAKKADEESKQFFDPKTGGGTIQNTMVYSDEFPQGIPAVQFAKEKGIKLDDPKGNGFAIIGDVAPDNPFTPKGKQAMLGGEAVVLDDRFSRHSEEDVYKHNMGQAKFNGTGENTWEQVNPADGKKYRFTSFSPDGQTITRVDKVEIKD